MITDQAEAQDESPPTPTSSLPFVYVVSFFFFLLPVKFGSSWLRGNIPGHPLGAEVVYNSWPHYFLAITSALLLSIAVIIYRPAKISKLATYSVCAWLLAAATSGIFGYYQDNVGFYYNNLIQLTAIITFALTAAICLQYDNRSQQLFIAAISGGTLYVTFSGLYQYFWGFEATINYYKEQASLGIYYPPEVTNRVMQKLVYSNFIISNSFAAHLILTVPLLFYVLLKKFNKENPETVKIIAASLLIFGIANVYSSANPVLGIFTLIVGAIVFINAQKLPDSAFKVLALLLGLTTLVILFLTKSRAGIICFVAGLVFCTCTKYKKLGPAVFIGGGIAAWFLAANIGSFQVRLHYYKTLISMFLAKPFGYGFGSFPEVYNKTKGAGIEECNVPHSFFFGYLGQGGILSGLAVILIFAITLWFLHKRQCNPFLKYSVAAGFASWFFHAQLDFNIMITGTAATAATICFCLPREKENSSEKEKNYSPLFTATIPLAITILYFCIHLFIQERQYAQLHEKLYSSKAPAGIEEIQSIQKKMHEKATYTSTPDAEIAHWAFRSYQITKSNILKFEYLNLAEISIKRAIKVTPKRSNFYALLAQVYFAKSNYSMALEMFDKSYELYPYAPGATKAEKEILVQLLRRYPQKEEYILKYFENSFRSMENSLGLMRFGNKTGYAHKDLKSIYEGLDKAASDLYTMIGALKKGGIKLEITPITDKIDKILKEAKQLLGNDF